MDSPFSNMPRPAVLSRSEREAADDSRAIATTDPPTQADTVLVVGFGNPVVADYAAYVTEHGHAGAVVIADDKVRRLVEAPIRSMAIDDFLGTRPETTRTHGRVDSLVLFVSAPLTPLERRQLDDIFAVANRYRIRFVAIVSSFRVHLGDLEAIEAENEAVSRATNASCRVVVFRPGHVLSRHSHLLRRLERLAPFYPLIPRRLSSCFVDANELFVAIEAERHRESQVPGLRESWQSVNETQRTATMGRQVGLENRAYTILGENRPWREMLFRHRTAAPGKPC